MFDVDERTFINYVLQNFGGKVTFANIKIGYDDTIVYRTNDTIFNDELKVNLLSKKQSDFVDTFIITPTNEEYHYLFSIKTNQCLKFAIDIDALLIRDFYILEERVNFKYKGVEWEIKTKTDIFKKILELDKKVEFFKKLDILLEEREEYGISKNELQKYLKEIK